MVCFPTSVESWEVNVGTSHAKLSAIIWAAMNQARTMLLRKRIRPKKTAGTRRRVLPVLPQEIIDMIICSLTRGADWYTLRNCSLTSRNWLSISRAQLFHSIVLHNEGYLRKVHTLLEKSPHIGNYVRRLELNFDDARSSQARMLLNVVFEHLGNVRILALSGRFPPNGTFRLPRMGSVTTLVLYRMTCPAIDDLSRLLDSLPNVRVYKIVALSMPTTATPSQSMSTSALAPSAHELNIERCHPITYPFFLSSPLRILSIKVDQEAQLQGFHDAFRTSNAAETLNTLRLEVWDPTLGCDEGSSQKFKSMLGQCPALKHVHFCAYQSISWVATLLSCATPDLVTIRVDGFVRHLGELEYLARVLDHDRYRRLERVDTKLSNFSLLSNTVSDVDLSTNSFQRVFGSLIKRGKVVMGQGR